MAALLIFLNKWWMNKENKFKTPILIIAWKRPKQTKELIKKVKEINPYKLYPAIAFIYTCTTNIWMIFIINTNKIG